MKTCPNCNNPMEIDTTIDATCCSCCGNVYDVTTGEVITKLICSEDKPGFMLPFDIDEGKAAVIFEEEINKAKKPDTEFMNQHPVSKIRKVYAPAYFVNTNSTLFINGVGRSYTDKRIAESKIEALVTIGLKDVPFVVAEGITNYLATEAEAFDISKAVPVDNSVEYMDPEYKIQEISMRVFKRIKNLANENIKHNTLGYQELEYLNSQSLYAPIDFDVKLGLLPLYVADVGDLQFIINGQTGKFAGQIPLDEAYEAKLQKKISRDEIKSFFYTALTLITLFTVGIVTYKLAADSLAPQLLAIEEKPIEDYLTVSHVGRVADYAAVRMKVAGIASFLAIVAIFIWGRINYYLTKFLFPKKPVVIDTTPLSYIDTTSKISVQKQETLGSIRNDPRFAPVHRILAWYYHSVPE